LFDDLCVRVSGVRVRGRVDIRTHNAY
jgi:hypothetical protein